MDGFVAPRPRLGLPRRSLHGASDERLVAQIRGADGSDSRSAFEILYDRHHRGVLAFSRHMLGCADEAEDAVQHTFAAAYRALLADDRPISLRAWLYTIARNRCLSLLAARRDQVALDVLEAVLPSTLGLAFEVEQRADLRDLLSDLQRLPEDQRAALVLAELEAHSHNEIAEVLGVPPSKVKALVFQARESLVIRRRARAADCTEIREQLSVLRGGALRRRELRRHVDVCDGCRAFEAEVRLQRASMALLLPVAPTLALKHSSLAAAFTATGAGAAAGAGAMAGGGGAVAFGGMAIGAKTVGTKLLAAIAIGTTAGGGGYVAVEEVTKHARAVKPAEARATAAAPVGSTGSTGSGPATATEASSATPIGTPVATQTPLPARPQARSSGGGLTGAARSRVRAQVLAQARARGAEGSGLGAGRGGKAVTARPLDRVGALLGAGKGRGTGREGTSGAKGGGRGLGADQAKLAALKALRERMRDEFLRRLAQLKAQSGSRGAGFGRATKPKDRGGALGRRGSRARGGSKSGGGGKGVPSASGSGAAASGGKGAASAGGPGGATSAGGSVGDGKSPAG